MQQGTPHTCRDTYGESTWQDASISTLQLSLSMTHRACGHIQSTSGSTQQSVNNTSEQRALSQPAHKQLSAYIVTSEALHLRPPFFCMVGSCSNNSRQQHHQHGDDDNKMGQRELCLLLPDAAVRQLLPLLGLKTGSEPPTSTP